MNPDATDADDLLIRQVKEGNEQAMHTLYCRYIRYLSAVCSRYISSDEDVKDVLQNVFIKIFDSVDKFEYSGEGSVKGWITKILINESLKYLKKKDGLNFVELRENELDVPDEEPDTHAIPPEIIYSMIRGLPEGYRVVFNLFVIEGKSHKEIAALLGIKENSSASQLHRAKAILAEKIKKYNSLHT